MLINRQAYRFDRRPPTNASLVLDFERGYARVSGKAARIDDILSVARSTIGPGIEADGSIVSVGANLPRYSRVPGRAGLIVERAVTNVALFSSNPTATWVLANGMSGYFNNTDGIDGAFTAGRVTDNAAAGSPAGTVAQTIAVAATAQWWTASIYVRVSGGPRVRIFLGITNGGSAVGGDTIFDTDVGAVVSAGAGVVARVEHGRAGYIRLVVSVYNTVGAGALVMLMARENDAASPLSIAFDRAQINSGASPTTALRTTTAAVSRAADVATVDLTAASWFKPTLGTIMIDATINGDPDKAQTLLALAGPSGNWIDIYRNYSSGAATLAGRSTVGGAVSTFGSAAGALALPRRVRAALSFNAGFTWQMAISGLQYEWANRPYASGVVTLTGTGTAPASFNTLQIGHLNGGFSLDGVIHKIAYMPAVNDATGLTALVS